MPITRRTFGALSAGVVLTACSQDSTPTESSIRHFLETPFLRVQGRHHKVPTLASKTGDMDLPPNEELIFAFPGIKLQFSTRGSYVAVEQISSTNETAWDIKIDDGAWKRLILPMGTFVIELPGNIDTPHHITMVRRTEAWQGTNHVLRIVSNAEFQAPPVPPKRKLLFIGDSITCGANSELSGADGISGEIISNARLSYGRILGDALDAQVHLVAYGGKGLVRDWQGLTSEVTAPQYFERALPDDPNSVWDHSQYVPDAIGVCLGQNDFNQGIPDRENWVGTYAKFLRRIRETAPKATIFVINSPMSRDDGPGSKGGALLSYLDEITRTASDPLFKRANVSHYPGVTPTDGHPSTASHAKIAAELLPAFTKAFK